MVDESYLDRLRFLLHNDLILRWNSQVYEDGPKPRPYEEMLRGALMNLMTELIRKEEKLGSN